MGYLDNAGLAHLWEKVRTALAEKQAGLSGRPGQVVGFSPAGEAEAQYLNLGQVSDGSPVGTIISYLGLTAPADYLVCDGAEHSVSDYPALADFFRQQFGSVNHFGGDGEVTFAVPDMRNLFLRGYHGGAEESLSGEVGARQEATTHVNITKTSAGTLVAANSGTFRSVQNADTDNGSSSLVIGDRYGRNAEIETSDIIDSYTARPVNMAVLFCIKALESVPAENLYSTEETRIGTWIDGKPLYRKTLVWTSPDRLNAHYEISDVTFTDMETLVNLRGTLYREDSIISIPDANTIVSVRETSKKVAMFVTNDAGGCLSRKTIISLEYTKTTD